MGRLLAQLFEITALFDMRLRPELVLLQKTMVTVEGVARRIDPDHDIWAAAEPVVAPLDRARAVAGRQGARLRRRGPRSGRPRSRGWPSRRPQARPRRRLDAQRRGAGDGARPTPRSGSVAGAAASAARLHAGGWSLRLAALGS